MGNPGNVRMIKEHSSTRIGVAWFGGWAEQQRSESHQRKWRRRWLQLLFIHHQYGLDVEIVDEWNVFLGDWGRLSHCFIRRAQCVWQRLYIKELWTPLMTKLSPAPCVLYYTALYYQTLYQGFSQWDPRPVPGGPWKVVRFINSS